MRRVFQAMEKALETCGPFGELKYCQGLDNECELHWMTRKGTAEPQSCKVELRLYPNDTEKALKDIKPL